MIFRVPSRFSSALQVALPFELTRHEIAIHHLPEAFHGFTLVQLSDLHIDRWNTELLEAAIPWVNEMQADLVVCTGDTIANGKEYLGALTGLMQQLRATHGKFACLGNHDYSDGEGSLGVRRALAKAEFEVLINESVPIWVRHQKLNMAGVDDFINGRQCLRTTVKRVDPQAPTLLLSHNPENFEYMARFNPSLVLSGHTHGGQIPLPKSLHRFLLGTSYVAGHYRQSGSQLYVNRGLGSAVFIHRFWKHRLSLPTPRILVRPEVSVFTLVNPSLQSAPHQPTEALQALAG